MTGIVYKHCMRKGCTVNSKYCQEVLRTFLSHLRRKRPEKFGCEWLLHQDSTRPHVSKATMNLIKAKKVKPTPHIRQI